MKKFFRQRLNKKGFTLVELLIVIAVLGIIAGIGVTSMTGVTGTFKDKADAETAEMLGRNVEVLCLAGKTFTENAAGHTAIETALGDALTNSKSQVSTSQFKVVGYSVGTDGEGSVTFSNGLASTHSDYKTYVVNIVTKKVQ